jgi:voltage-gated potassium channel
MSLHRRTWEIVEAAKPGDTASRVFDVLILGLIFLNVIAVMLGSVQSIQEHWDAFLDAFETVSVLVFTVEYVSRRWSCTADPRFIGPIRGRLRFAIKAMAIIDLLAILPFYLPFLGIDLRSLRVLRLLRILRVAKVGRYYSSLNLIKHVFHAKKEELVLTSVMMGLLLVVSSSLLYYCENTVQPDAFSSIPATMWWAVATLTTVGYGDMYPITLLGRFLASIIAILGIGMFALPTGILGAGFVEAIQKQKEQAQRCPHCGKEIR